MLSNKRKYLFLIFPVLFFYNNCGGPFEVANVQDISSNGGDSLDDYQNDIISGKSLYQTNCSTCHGPLETSAKRNTNSSLIIEALQAVPQMSFLKDRLNEEQVDQIALVLSDQVNDSIDLSCDSAPDVGFVAMHRLNQYEYRNTIRSLTGVSLTADSQFPKEESENFPNTAVRLRLTTTQMDWYLNKALDIAKQVVSSSSLRSRFYSCNLDSANCRSTAIKNFADKAFRRPASNQELSAFQGLADEQLADGSSSLEAIETTYSAILTSPQFLYRNTSLANPRSKDKKEKLSPYELASRISYFIWGDAPDSTLTNKALAGDLEDREKLRVEITRMMQDSRAKENLSKNFFSYWFGLNEFEARTPNQSLYPDFTSSVHDDMMKESELYFEDMVANNRTLGEVLTTPATYLNQNLANFYGIPGSFNSSFKKVDTTGTDRMGVLTQGSLLTTTSHSSGTSIVRRGAFVAFKLQCIEVGAPPDGTISLEPSNGTESIRQRMEAHRSNPQCISCHRVMDPPGFGLENFNAVGQWRTRDDDGFPLDTHGVLFSGQSFQNARELASILSDEPVYQKCAIGKLASFSLGRDLEDFDKCTIEKIAKNAGSKSLIDIMVELISSDPYQFERGD